MLNYVYLQKKNLNIFFVNQHLKFLDIKYILAKINYTYFVFGVIFKKWFCIYFNFISKYKNNEICYVYVVYRSIVISN